MTIGFWSSQKIKSDPLKRGNIERTYGVGILFIGPATYRFTLSKFNHETSVLLHERLLKVDKV